MGRKLIILISLLFVVMVGYFLISIFKSDPCTLLLTGAEQEIYDSFVVEYDSNILAEADPLLICKLYLHAMQTNDTDTGYQLVSKDQKYATYIPSKDEFLIESFFHYGKLSEEAYEECHDLKVTVGKDGIYATVSWISREIEKVKGQKDSSRFTFKLVKDENSWKVLYPPFNS